MFYGKWSIKVDYKWRLAIPKKILKYFNDKVFLYQKNEVIRIENFDNLLLFDKGENIFVCEFKDNGRILIPKYLRGSPSFYFGKTVLLAGRGDYIEIWPRPQNK
jgi:DNA-binding transcriptional regulator/RsmH inhibitor MraZ